MICNILYKSRLNKPIKALTRLLSQNCIWIHCKNPNKNQFVMEINIWWAHNPYVGVQPEDKGLLFIFRPCPEVIGVTANKV